MRLIVPGLTAALLLAGCTSQVPSYPVPPPLPAETIPLPPVSEQALIWRPGDWAYVNGSYRYEPGQFEPRGAHGPLWIRGQWAGPSGNYVWMPGHWN